MRWLVGLALALALVLPARAGAIEVGADIRRSGDGVGYRGWAADANRRAVYSWRLRLWSDMGEFGWRLLYEDIRQAITGTSSITMPLFTVFDTGYLCVYFYVYRSRTVGRNRVGMAHDCIHNPPDR